MLPTDRRYLAIVAESFDHIAGFTAGLDPVALNASPLHRSAVERQFIRAGEAVKRLTLEFRAANPEHPWKDVAGFRDILVHDLESIEPRIVWQAAEVDAPRLRAAILRILSSDDNVS